MLDITPAGADRDETKAIFDAYTGRGGNFIDTANAYTNGTAEQMIGEFARTRRDQLVIATKYTMPTRPGDPNSGGNSRKSMVRSVEDSGVTDSAAVAGGLARTGRIITSAAAIMICVFAAFVLGDLRVLRVIGLGMAVAVLLDATLVRMVAMPAALQLMGRANWWFPRRLDRSVPGFLSEIEPRQPAGASSPAGADTLA